MTPQEKRAALEKILGPGKESSYPEIIFWCPRNIHSSPKLWVNIVTDKFQCFVCSYASRSLLPLLTFYDKNTEDSRKYLENVHQFSHIFLAAENKGTITKNEVHLPQNLRSLSEHYLSLHANDTAKAYDYLLQRGISFRQMVQWKLGFCRTGDFATRIIIPSFDALGRLNYFTGRSWHPKPYLRYKNCEASRDIIFNDLYLDWTQPLILTEGPIDALKTQDNATPLLGSSLMPALLRKILKYRPLVYLGLDADMQKKQRQIAEKLLSFGIDVKLIPLGKFKDIGEMTKEEYLQAKEKAISVDFWKLLTLKVEKEC